MNFMITAVFFKQYLGAKYIYAIMNVRYLEAMYQSNHTLKSTAGLTSATPA